MRLILKTSETFVRHWQNYSRVASCSRAADRAAFQGRERQHPGFRLERRQIAGGLREQDDAKVILGEPSTDLRPLSDRPAPPLLVTSARGVLSRHRYTSRDALLGPVRHQTAGFRILEWVNYSNVVIEHYEKMLSSPPKLTSRLIFGDDAPERQRNSQRNLIEGRTIYWMITAERPTL
jgi:hypothetical protein